MKILFYDAKQYDIESFNKQLKDYPEITVDYIETAAATANSPLYIIKAAIVLLHHNTGNGTTALQLLCFA